MKRSIIFILLITLLIVNSACSAGNINTDSQSGDSDQPNTSAAATATPPVPTATPNPYLVDDSLQPPNATIFGRGGIDRSFLSKDGSTLLVQNDLGVFIYDVDSAQELAYFQPWYKVVAFDGEKGYLFKMTETNVNANGERTYEYRNLIPFTWDGSIYKFEPSRSLYGADGEELDISSFSVNPEHGLIFGITQYERNKRGVIMLGTPRQNLLWKNDGKDLLANFGVNNVWNAVFAPDGSHLAFFSMQNSDAVVRLAEISEENSGSSWVINTHRDVQMENLAFSPDSSKVLSADRSGMVFVYDIESGSKYRFTLTDEDYLEESRAHPIGKAVFLDEARVAIVTNSGMLLIWDPETGSLEKYSLTENPINDMHVISPDEMLFFTDDGAKRYTISTGEVSSFLESDMWGRRVAIHDDRLLKANVLSNNQLQIEVWDIASFTKLRSEVLPIELGDDRLMKMWETKDGQLVMGCYWSRDDADPIFILDQENFEMVETNLENENISAEYSPVFVEALDQYVAVGLSRYELVFASADDPLFREPLARMKTLREIRSFTVSPDGSMAYALTEGMIQAFGLDDPSRSYSITDRDFYSYYGIDAVNEEKLLLASISSRQSSLALLDLASQEMSPVALPTQSDAKLDSLSGGEGYPAGVYAFSYENWGVVVYDVLNERTVKQFRIADDPSGLYWYYTLFPEEGLLLGQAGGYSKLQEVNINF